MIYYAINKMFNGVTDILINGIQSEHPSTCRCTLVQINDFIQLKPIQIKYEYSE